MLPSKQFSSFDVAAVIRELRETILDCRVRNIYQLDSKILLLKLRKPEKPVFWLLLEAGRRLNLTRYSQEKPMLPPAFCMALRKFLRNSFLTNVEQHGFERVVVLTLEHGLNVMRLIVELFGEGNAILVDSDGNISNALNYKRMRDRDILRGKAFRFAPPLGRNPLKMDKEEMHEELKTLGDVEVVRVLARRFGVGGFYSEEVLLRAGVDKRTLCKKLSDSLIDTIFEELQHLISEVLHDELTPCTVLDKTGQLVDVIPVELRQYKTFKYECFGSFNEAVDEFYVRMRAVEKALAAAAATVEELNEEANRLARIVESQRDASDKAKTDAETNKRVGDLIYRHSGELQHLMRKFLIAKRRDQDWEKLISKVLTEKEAGERSSALFESFDDRRLIVNVNVEGCSFSLNLRRTVFENAAHFYERYKRAKRKWEGAVTALKGYRKRLSDVQTKLTAAETSESVSREEVLERTEERKIKRKKWFEKFKWFISSEGFLVVAGKDAVSNEVLVKKHAEEGDIVFHADVVGAPFVVVKTEGREPSKQCLSEAAVFAASFSRVWRESFASIDVYWIKPEQLSKKAPSGEYLRRGGFAVRGRRNWMRGTPLRLAVGVVKDQSGEAVFVGGPVDAVKDKTNAYVIVVPGDLKGKELFSRILEILKEETPKKMLEKISKASAEDIREFIPYNRGRILQR